VSVFGSNGSLVSTEVTGAYGVPLQGAPSDYSSSPEAWVVDGLHGQEEDRGNEVSHFGARHTLFRDGMWMQPEPLLGLGRGIVGNPGGMSGMYAAGNPISFMDTSGWASDSLAEIDGQDVTSTIVDAANGIDENRGGPDREGAQIIGVNGSESFPIESRYAGGEDGVTIRGNIGEAEVDPGPSLHARLDLFHSKRRGGRVAGVVHSHPDGRSSKVSGVDLAANLLMQNGKSGVMAVSTGTKKGGTIVAASIAANPAGKSGIARKIGRILAGGMDPGQLQTALNTVAPGSQVRVMDRKSSVISTPTAKPLSRGTQRRLDQVMR